MTDGRTQFDRRTVLKGAAGSLAIAGVGGGALLATTGSAAAQSFSIDDTTVTLDDGVVSYVDVEVAGTTTWDGFDVPVRYLRFTSEVRLPHADTGWHTLVENNQTAELPDGVSGEDDSDGWGGPGEYVESYGGDTPGTAGSVHTDVDWRLVGDSGKSIETPAPWADELEVPGDGDTTAFTVQKRQTVEFLDADEEVISDEEGVGESQETASFSLEVTNQPSATGGDADGDSTAG